MPTGDCGSHQLILGGHGGLRETQDKRKRENLLISILGLRRCQINYFGTKNMTTRRTSMGICGLWWVFFCLRSIRKGRQTREERKKELESVSNVFDIV